MARNYVESRAYNALGEERKGKKDLERRMNNRKSRMDGSAEEKKREREYKTSEDHHDSEVGGHLSASGPEADVWRNTVLALQHSRSVRV